MVSPTGVSRRRTTLMALPPGLRQLVEAIGSGERLTGGLTPFSVSILTCFAADEQREVGRREQEADPFGPTAACHAERGADSMDGHKAELARSRRIAAAGD